MGQFPYLTLTLPTRPTAVVPLARATARRRTSPGMDGLVHLLPVNGNLLRGFYPQPDLPVIDVQDLDHDGAAGDQDPLSQLPTENEHTTTPFLARERSPWPTQPEIEATTASTEPTVGPDAHVLQSRIHNHFLASKLPGQAENFSVSRSKQCQETFGTQLQEGTGVDAEGSARAFTFSPAEQCAYSLSEKGEMRHTQDGGWKPFTRCLLGVAET